MPYFCIVFLILIGCASQPKIVPEARKTNTPEFDRSEVVRTIQSKRKYLSQCYGQTLMQKGNEKLKGLVFVSFKIGPDGKAVSPQVIPEKSTLNEPELNKCLFAGISSWDFPVHPGGEPLEIRYPFRFHDAPPTNMQNKLDQFERLKSN